MRQLYKTFYSSPKNKGIKEREKKGECEEENRTSKEMILVEVNDQQHRDKSDMP